VKEAVHNVIKHAQASEITLRVAWSEGWLTIALQDNGRGFSQNGAPTGHGLNNMKRRLAELGGTCSIQSEAGGGTTVQMRLKVGLPRREQSIPVPALPDGANRTVSGQNQSKDHE